MSKKTSASVLHAHARQGWLWGAIDQFAQRGLTMIVSLVLARMLEPADFGLIASVGIFFGIAGQIIDGGIGQRVLQKQAIQEEDYCALFWCNGLISLLCGLALVAASGVISLFYGNPQLKMIVIVLAVNIFLMNAGRVQETRLMRELRFKASSMVRIFSIVAGCVVGLAMAFVGCGVWAILGQQLATAITRAVILWILVPWRPSVLPAWPAVKDLYGYGLPVLFSQTVRAIAAQLINVLIAKRGALATLGFYDRGRVMPQSLGYSLANIFSRTNFPILAKLQHDEIAFRDTYLRFLGITSAIYFMLMTGLAVCANDVIGILLGAKWLPSAWFLQANCVAFSIYVVFTANSELLRSKGRTGIFFRYNMICAGLQVVGVVAGIPWGVRGMVVGDILARGLICIPLVVAISKISQVTVLCQLRSLVRPFFGAVTVSIVLMVVKLTGLSLWPRFILCGFAGASVIFVYWRTEGFRHFRLGFNATGAR